MKVLLTILLVVLMAPVLLLAGIALGPAALVILFIAGFAIIATGVVGLVAKASSNLGHRTKVPPLHR